MDGYVEVKELIDELVKRMASRTHATYICADYYVPWSTSDYVVRLSILKAIYEHGGRYIHWVVKELIFTYQEVRYNQIEIRFKNFLKVFSRCDKTCIEGYDPIPDEKLVLDCEKQPLSWWKDKVEKSGSDELE